MKFAVLPAERAVNSFEDLVSQTRWRILPLVGHYFLPKQELRGRFYYMPTEVPSGRTEDRILFSPNDKNEYQRVFAPDAFAKDAIFVKSRRLTK